MRPRFALRLLGVALLTWLASALYTVRWNPEIAFFRRADRLKQTWAEQLDRRFPHKVVVFGGSSCTVSIDGAGLLEHEQLPVLNLGLGAGMGAKVLTEYALQHTRPGDTVVMAMEPPLIAATLGVPALGVQFCYATGDTAVLRNLEGWSWPGTAMDLRPGGYHTFTLLGKLLLHQPLYRYRQSELQPGGWHRLELQRAFVPDEPTPLALVDEDRAWLAGLRDWCHRHEVRIAYSLPWAYAPAARAEAYRRRNAAFLLQVSRYLPVLKDPRLGVYTVRTGFADTEWHLIPAAAELRSKELAQQVRAWQCWSPAELGNFK
ncbi:MAG: hypothetical protein KGS61_06595 [Verrucomicrobia bacterium]|nr:hypothetical protein [Verrucomicrobiota bacterium]